MTTRFSLTAIAAFALVYSCWLTNAYTTLAGQQAGSLQLQLSMQKRIEELQRTRYGAISNSFTCKLRRAE